MYKLKFKETIGNSIKFQLFAGKIAIICTNWFETHVIWGCKKSEPVQINDDAGNTLQAVDLGLSVKWANMNIGATSIYEPGGYFAWGESSEKTTYIEENYKFHRSAEARYSCNTYIKNTSGDYVYLMTTEESQKVYSCYWVNNLKEDGIADYFKYVYEWIDFVPDNLTNLLIDTNDEKNSDDSAAAILKKGWRMPTKDECMELVSKCKIEVKLKDSFQTVIEITGPNGNSIDFPLNVGYKEAGSKHSSGVYFWTNEVDKDNPLEAFAITIWSSSYDCGTIPRTYGLTVRPVHK